MQKFTYIPPESCELRSVMETTFLTSSIDGTTITDYTFYDLPEE